MIAYPTLTIRYKENYNILLSILTFDEIINDLSDDNDPRKVHKYSYNKQFKMYSRLPMKEIPNLPSDVDTTDYVQYVLEHGDDLIIKIRVTQDLKDNKSTENPTTVGYLVRSSSSLMKKESTVMKCSSHKTSKQTSSYSSSDDAIDENESDTEIELIFSSSRPRKKRRMQEEGAFNDELVRCIHSIRRVFELISHEHDL